MLGNINPCNTQMSVGFIRGTRKLLEDRLTLLDPVGEPSADIVKNLGGPTDAWKPFQNV